MVTSATFVMDAEIVLRQSEEVELVLGAPLPRQRALVFVNARIQLANTVDGARRSNAVQRLGNAEFRPRHCPRPRRSGLPTPTVENGHTQPAANERFKPPFNDDGSNIPATTTTTFSVETSTSVRQHELLGEHWLAQLAASRPTDTEVTDIDNHHFCARNSVCQMSGNLLTESLSIATLQLSQSCI